MPDDVQDLRTEAVENFLKAVYVLQQQVDPVPTNLLAQMLNIKAPSVTDMVKRLSGIEDDKDKKRDRRETRLATPLLDYEPYRGVRLTPMGERIALEVIRHHRLLELYLSEALGYSWDEVHDEADRLEHVISERFEERIAAALGNPELDPHGDPIPAADGTIAARDLVFLSDLPARKHGTVSRILDQSPEVLRYLSGLGLVPGAKLTLLERSPLNDTVSIRIDGEKPAHTISTHVARKVLVVGSKSK
jgi:DtxR family transcriptional regulator, Mn-dependent transcriptional regulator